MTLGAYRHRVNMQTPQTCVVRAWDLNNPMLVAPAMNTLMYQHKFTAKHLDVLKNELNIGVIDTIEKKLMCGDIGMNGRISTYYAI